MQGVITLKNLVPYKNNGSRTKVPKGCGSLKAIKAIKISFEKQSIKILTIKIDAV